MCSSTPSYNAAPTVQYAPAPPKPEEAPVISSMEEGLTNDKRKRARGTRQLQSPLAISIPDAARASGLSIG
jgi:hypothetical protein